MAKEKIEAQPTVNPGDLSELLQRYREKAGYTLTQMADALCLSEDTIEKLENEDFQALAEPPYIRGYLRNYAKMAELDPSDLILRYEALRGADPGELDYHFKTSSTIHATSKRRISPILAQLFFLGLLVVILVGISMIPSVNKWITTTWNSFSSQTNSQEILNSDNPLLTGTMPVPTPLPIVEPATTQDSTNENALSTSQGQLQSDTTPAPPKEIEKNQPEPISDAKKNEAQDTPKKAEPKADSPAAAETATNSTDQINIKLVFNKEVWMRIRNKNNKTLFEATNSAGNEKVLNLQKPLTFRVGNAQGLSLFVDNKPVDISTYIKGSVANFTLE